MGTRGRQVVQSDLPTRVNPPRLHHYFPQFHLNYFAQADTKLWTHDRRTRFKPNPKAIPLARLAAEAGLYDDDHPEGGLEGIEEWLADHVDGPASTVIRKVVAREDINAHERADLGRYVMSRDLRTPATRDFIMDRAQKQFEVECVARMSDTTAIRTAIRADSGIDIPEDQIAALAGLYRPTVTKGFWLDFLQRHSDAAAPRLLGMGWTLFHTDDGAQFITSDIGIVKFRGGWDRPVPFAPGWWIYAEAWLMPLTPKLALAMAPGLLPNQKLAGRPYVDVVNRTLAAQSSAFTFAHDEHELRRAIGGI